MSNAKYFFSHSVQRKIDKAIASQLSSEKNTYFDDRTTTRLHDKATESAQNMVILSSSKRREQSTRASILEEGSDMKETSSKVELTASRVSNCFLLWKYLPLIQRSWESWNAFLYSQKPVILRVPQSENFSSLSDIMRRLHPQQSTSGQFKRASKTVVSEMSQSMMDLSILSTDTNHDEKGVPVPRFKARVSVLCLL